jgi:flagellar hook-associated protein 1 FlgK
MLNVTLSGLRAFQTALNTTSHNIANVATEGYSRQRVDLTTQTPQGVAGAMTGSGVRIDGISRNADDLLAAQMRRSSSTYSRLDTYTDKAGALNNLFADSKTGLSAALQKFTNALQGVANAPSSVSARQVLLSEADGLVTRLQTYQSRLDDLDTEINEQLRAEATSINSIAQNIARLNQEIARASSVGGSPPNDLLDARDRQLADLASRVDTSVVKQDDGSVNVFIGKGQPLVVGFLPSEVVAQPDAFQPNRITLGFKTPSGVVDIEKSLSGGSVGGLLDFRREMLDPSRNELGRMAVALTEVTNAQHQAGQDLYGDLGGDFFSVGGVEVLQGRANTGAATLTATRTGAAQLTADDYVVRFDGTWKVQRADNGQPVAYTVGGGGELQFEGLEVTVSGAPAVGDRFLVRPAGDAISGLKLLVSDPSRVAAAVPIRTAAVSGNAGTAQISSGEVLDVTDPALRDPVTIRFTNPPGNWEALDATNTVIASGPYVPGGNIDVNGWRVQVTGQPVAGDSFTVAGNTGGVGDNRNALKLAAVLSQGVLSGGTESLDAAAGRLVSTVGVTTNGANASLEAQKIIFDDSVAAVDSLAGVNLDEEAANMMRYQQAYQAAAQMIRVTQTIFDTIINSVGR